MSGSHARLLLFVSVTALGAAGGELWVRYLRGRASRSADAERSSLRSTDTARVFPGGTTQRNRLTKIVRRSSDTSTASKQSQFGGQASRATVDSDQTSHSTDDQEQLPPAGAALQEGRAGTYILHGAEYVTGGASRKTPPPGVMSSSPVRERIRKRLLTFKESRLARAKRMAEPPWGKDRFQIVAGLIPGCSLAVVGRDFALTASPEESVAWYEKYYGLNPGEASRQEATELLRQWEAERRTLLASIIDRSLDLISQGTCARKDAIAYGIVGRQLGLIRPGESPELESVLAAGSLLQDEVVAEALKILE